MLGFFRCCLFILLHTSALATSAQQFTLTGKITEAKGSTVPFASVYVNTTTQGTSSNIDGNYKIVLPAGKSELLFTSVGYEDRTVKIDMKANITLDIVLSSKIFTLNDVIIRSSVGNRADDIIRKVIAKRKVYQNEIEAFSCDVYTKAMQKLLTAPKKFFGRDVATILDLDSNRQGVIYLSETESKLDYKQRNKVKEVIVSSKVAGNEKGFSLNKASDLSVNFYDNILFEGKMGVRGFVSPVADNAFRYYQYKFLGNSQEAGKVISKIQVTPKRKNAPAFSGFIYIVNDEWRIKAVNLWITKENGITLLDTLTINQQLIEVDQVYVPQSIQFTISGKLLGFKFAGYVMGVYKNYKLQTKFNTRFFTNEILKVERASNKKDPNYWEKNRLVPLTVEESNNYKRKDSISILKSSQQYLDSIDRVKNKFTLQQILITPYINYRSYNKKSVTYDALSTSIFYNTVEGLALKYAVTWRSAFENGSYYAITPEMRYGFANRHFNPNIKAKYLLDPIRNASVTVGLGAEVVNLNANQNTNLLQNTANALLFGKNVAKFYERQFFKVEASREFAPSFELKIGADYAKRTALTNSNFHSFRKNPAFTANNPFAPNNENSLLFPEHKALVFSGRLAYTIAQKYITRPDGRFYVESDFPKIEISYKRALKGLFGSTIDYDFISLEIYQKTFHLGMLGKSALFVEAGKFLTSKNLNYPDWKHFRANQSLVFDPDERNFQFLDFYIFNTNKQYFEAHFQHNFGGFIFNKIPLLRKLKLEEIIGGAYLSSPEKRNYNEFYFGVKRLNFRVHYGYAYDRDVMIKKGFKFSYGFSL